MPRKKLDSAEAIEGARLVGLLSQILRNPIGRAALIATVAPLVPAPVHDGDPDFVWVGCGTCWQPQDASRPMRAYAEWLSDGHRHLPFFCRTCTNSLDRHIESFPTLWAAYVDDFRPFREGSEAPEPAPDVEKWGR